MFTQFKTRQDEIKVTIIDIPFIPQKVTLDDLDKNYRLLTPDAVKNVKAQNLENGHHHKKNTGCKYTIIRQDDDYYAVYKGKSKKLGAGNFGKVKLVQHLDTGEWSAEKINDLRAEDAIPVAREFSALQKMSLLAYAPLSNVPVFFNYKGGRFPFEQNAMLMKYLHGDLLSNHISSLILRHKPSLPALAYINMVLSLAKQLDQFEIKKIIHRDIKPENTLLSTLFLSLYLIDFGFSIEVEGTGPIIDEDLGTSGYKSKDQKNGVKCEYSFKSDIFSIGVTLEELFQATRNLFTPDQEQLHKSLDQFIVTMKSKQPDDRPSASKILEFFTDLKSKLEPKNKILTICMLDAADIYNDSTIINLSSYHQIWLYDSKSTMSERDFVKAKHFLENWGHCVGDKAIQGDDDIDLRAALANILKARHPEYGFTFGYAKEPVKTPVTNSSPK